MALRPVQFNILRYQASFRWRAFSLAQRGSKQASGEHVEERMFDSIPGAARICGAIPRKPQNRASANCEMWVEPNFIRIKGHRVGIESILRKYLAGRTAEDIARDYDTLRLVDIYATVTYDLQNKDEVDAYLRRNEQLIAEQMAHSDANPSPVVLRLRKLREERKASAGATP